MALNEKTRISAPLMVAISVVVGLVSSLLGAQASLYQWKNELIEKVDTEVSRSAVQLRLEREQALRYYLGREDFISWRERERARQDAQYYSLLNEIRRVGDRVGRSR